MARLKDLKVVMLKGDKGDVGFPSDEQVKGQIAEYINENPEVTINKEVIENTTTEWLNNNPTLGTQLEEKIDADFETINSNVNAKLETLNSKVDADIQELTNKFADYVPTETYDTEKKQFTELITRTVTANGYVENLKVSSLYKVLLTIPLADVTEENAYTTIGVMNVVINPNDVNKNDVFCVWKANEFIAGQRRLFLNIIFMSNGSLATDEYNFDVTFLLAKNK